MNDPFSPVFCVRCKRPNPGGGRMCEECCQDTPPAVPLVQAHPAAARLAPAPARWSPARAFLLLLAGSLLVWTGWAVVLSVILHGFGASLVQVLELCGTGLVPFGLVAADLWQDEDRFTLYGYAAAGYHLFFGVVACIQYREVADPLRHDLIYLLEAALGGALLLTLWIYRTTKRAYYES